jgi:hypothetical protein
MFYSLAWVPSLIGSSGQVPKARCRLRRDSEPFTPIGVGDEVWYHCYSDLGVARVATALVATERYSGCGYNDLFLL